MLGAEKAWGSLRFVKLILDAQHTRAQKLIVLVAPAVLIAVVAAGVVIVSGSAGGKGTTGAASSGHGGSVNAAAGTQASGGSHFTAPPRAAQTRGAKWVTGPAGKLIASVDADLGRITADERAGKAKAASGVGAQLTTDARAANHGPMPPEDAAVYRAALKDFERIGTDTAKGDFRAANSLLAAATLGIARVTAAADAGVDSAAALNDPS